MTASGFESEFIGSYSVDGSETHQGTFREPPDAEGLVDLA